MREIDFLTIAENLQVRTLKARLGGEIGYSDVNTHKGYCSLIIHSMVELTDLTLIQPETDGNNSVQETERRRLDDLLIKYIEIYTKLYLSFIN